MGYINLGAANAPDIMPATIDAPTTTIDSKGRTVGATSASAYATSVPLAYNKNGPITSAALRASLDQRIASESSGMSTNTKLALGGAAALGVLLLLRRRAP